MLIIFNKGYLYVIPTHAESNRYNKNGTTKNCIISFMSVILTVDISFFVSSICPLLCVPENCKKATVDIF